MVIVAAHWDLSYVSPITEIYMWAWPMRDMKVETLRMTPVSGIKNPERSVTLEEFPSCQDMLCADELPRVFFEPRTAHQNPNTTWLRDYEHPDDCVYVFGSHHYNPSLRHRRPEDPVVTIETPKNNGVLWSNQCMVVVLHDRLMKRWP